MKQYEVSFTNFISYSAKVHAENANEAMDKAYDLCEAGKLTPRYSIVDGFAVVEVEPVEQHGEE